MTSTIAIDSPKKLSELAEKIQTEPDTASSVTTVHVKLLALLCDEETMKACIDQGNQEPEADRPKLKSDILLNLDPLTTAWRKAWSTFPVDRPRTFIVDITVPEDVASWCRRNRERGGVPPNVPHILEDHVSRFACGIATVMAMRSKWTAKFKTRGIQEYTQGERVHEDGPDVERVCKNDGPGPFSHLEVTLARLSKLKGEGISSAGNTS